MTMAGLTSRGVIGVVLEKMNGYGPLIMRDLLETFGVTDKALSQALATRALDAVQTVYYERAYSPDFRPDANDLTKAVSQSFKRSLQNTFHTHCLLEGYNPGLSHRGPYNVMEGCD
jgi:hypothetical protein